MKNVYIRRFLLFFLCFSMLISLTFPAYAEETTDTGTFLAVSLPAEDVASSVMIGLGVLPGEDTQEYKSVVSRCVDYLIEQGRVINGKIEVWQREQVGDYSLWKYGVNVSMVDVVRSWLFDSKTVEQQAVTGATSYEINGEIYYFSIPVELVTYEYQLSETSGSFLYFFVSPEFFLYKQGSPPTVTSKGAEKTGFFYTWQFGSVSFNYDSLTPEALAEYRTKFGARYIGKYTFGNTPFNNSDALDGEITVSDGLTAGYIGVPSLALSAAYPDWLDNAITIPIPGTNPGTDEDVVVVPIAPGQTIDDTISIPQEDVWVGDGSYVDSPAVPETGTLTDILSAVLSLPQAIVGSIAQALANFFGISGTADAYAISLTDFFPFCIPFDIYEFLSVLSAAPEAPVFHWEIPVPQLGRTFDIDVDLSPWDPVAAVFRTFELLAFIVGLGMITREKFLRS